MESFFFMQRMRWAQTYLFKHGFEFKHLNNLERYKLALGHYNQSWVINMFNDNTIEFGKNYIIVNHMDLGKSKITFPSSEILLKEFSYDSKKPIFYIEPV